METYMRKDIIQICGSDEGGSLDQFIYLVWPYVISR